jgi:MFS family permease
MTYEAASAEAPPTSTGREPGRTRIAPILFAMFLINVFGYAAIAAVLMVLLPTQVRLAAGDGAPAALALITGVSAIASLAMPPIAGVLSDRTRTRWGRRSPWILIGGVATAAALVFMGFSGSVIGLLAGWFLVQATVNIGLNIILATIPERIPARRHGLASTVQGLGLPVGSILGVQLGAAFAESIEVGYIMLAGLFVIASLICAVLIRDASAIGPSRAERRSFVAEARTMFGSLRFRDYRWVFISRAVLYLGYNMVSTFGLYILQDYIVLPEGMTAVAGVATATTTGLILTTVGTLIAGPLVDKLGHHRAFVLASSLLLTGSMIVPFLWPSWTAYLIQAAVGGFALGVFLGVDLVLATLVLPKTGDAGRDLGVFHIALNAPQVIAPFLASLAVTSLGGYPTLFIFGAAISLFGSFAVLRVRREAITQSIVHDSQTEQA